MTGVKTPKTMAKIVRRRLSPPDCEVFVAIFVVVIILFSFSSLLLSFYTPRIDEKRKELRILKRMSSAKRSDCKNPRY